jgi:hypothetical protein
MVFLISPRLAGSGLVLRQFARHLAMGGTLGALCGLSLLSANYQGLADAIAGNEAPQLMRAIFVLGLSAQFGFGASITGFLLMFSDEG